MYGESKRAACASACAEPSYAYGERTDILAWIRTSIGIMAFGFVLEKFGLFLKQYAFILDASGGLKIQRVSATEYSSFWGVFLVGLGR